MAGEVSPLVRLLQQVTDNPAALRELMPSVGEAAERIPTEALSGPDVSDLMTRVRGRLAEFLSGARSEYSPTRPAASILRSQGATAPSPGVSAITAKAPSPARPVQMDIMDRLPAPGDPSTRAIPESAAPTQGQEAPVGPINMPQGPSMTSPAEMLRRPAGGERSDLIARVRDLLQSRQEGSKTALPELQRLKPQLQPQVPGLPPNVKEGLSRMGAIPEAEYPEPSPDQPITRIPYRGAPRTGTMNEPAFERFKSEGLKTSKLPQELQDMVDQLVSSGQLPPEIAGSENAMRSVLARVYGYKPRALAGGNKVVGEAAPSRVGLMLQQFSNLSPEEITNVLGSIRPSGIMREGQRVVRAEEAVPAYRALGESRDPKEVVADLLRGGPSPNLQGGEFARNVLYPIMRKRQAAGLSQGEPLTLEQVISALKGSRFLRSDQPNPARSALMEKVAEMMRKRGAK